MQKFEFFPSLVVIEQYPEWVEPVNKIAKLALKDTEINNEKYNINQGYNFHLEPTVKPFADIIGKMARNFLEEQGYDLKDHVLAFEGFWPQDFKKNGTAYHEVHTHSSSHVSGFFFLKCSENTPNAVFHDPRPTKMMVQLPEKDDKQITHASFKTHIQPVPGTLIMFNSFLPHSFNLHTSQEKFRFVHFTMIAIWRRFVGK